MTDINIEELKKRLLYLWNYSNFEYKHECKETVDAINRLQAEIERLHSILESAKKIRAESSLDSLASERLASAAPTDDVERLQAENAELRRELEEARKNADRYLVIRTHDLIDEIVVAAFGRDPSGDPDWQKSLDEWCDACITYYIQREKRRSQAA